MSQNTADPGQTGAQSAAPRDEVRTFSQFLAAAEDGQLHGQLTDAIRDIVSAMNEVRADQGGKPKATLSLSFDFKLDGSTVEVKAGYSVKLPKVERARSVFWTLPNNGLSRSNPRQMGLPFRDVTSGDAAAARTV
jgi:hypothetical protein